MREPPFIVRRPDGFVGVELSVDEQLTSAEARELAGQLSRCADEVEAERYYVFRVEPCTGGKLPDENVQLAFLVRIRPEHRHPTDQPPYVTWSSNFNFTSANTYDLSEARRLITKYGGQLCLDRNRG